MGAVHTAYTHWAAQPVAGVGVGLRSPHIEQVLKDLPPVPWFEILADNHTAPGGLIPRQLEAIRSRYPVTLHCVGMSLGGTDPLDMAYLAGIKRLARDYESAWVSDHLCFSSHRDREYHDLLPLPYTEEALQHASERIQRVQDYLGERILVENVSSYLEYNHSTLAEPDFIAALAEDADCYLLFDVNNAYVNQVNHGSPARAFLDVLPLKRIREIHLAGYEDKGGYLIDAHNNRVTQPVWTCYAETIRRMPDVPTLIEWDNDIPAFEVLLEEAHHAEQVAETSLTQTTSA
jgi:uncharacterized protein (UPF0276 family)